MTDSYQEALEHFDACSEMYGDLLTQYKAEVAHYGDAWPGAAHQLEAARQALVAAEQELNAISPSPTIESEAFTEASDLTDTDIPF